MLLAIACVLLFLFAVPPTSKSADLPDIDSLWDYADNAASEMRFREVLPLAIASGSDAYVVELLTQLARSEGRQGRFAEAIATLDRAEAIVTPEMVRARVRLLLERGRVFNSSGEAERAIPFFRDGFELAVSSKLNRLAVDAVHMIAIAEAEPEKQIEWNLRGIALAEELDERGWLRALYNNLGEAYASKKDFASALTAFQKLIALGVEQGKEPDVYAQKDVAKMLRLLGRYKEAISVLGPIQARLTESGQPNGYIEEELAECLLATGHGLEAQVHFARAFDLQCQDEWVVKHEAERLKRLKALSQP